MEVPPKSSIDGLSLIHHYGGTPHWWKAPDIHCRIHKKLRDIFNIPHHILFHINLPCVVLPSGKRLHNYGKSTFLMCKSTVNGHIQQLCQLLYTRGYHFFHRFSMFFPCVTSSSSGPLLQARHLREGPGQQGQALPQATWDCNLQDPQRQKRTW